MRLKLALRNLDQEKTLDSTAGLIRKHSRRKLWNTSTQTAPLAGWIHGNFRNGCLLNPPIRWNIADRIPQTFRNQTGKMVYGAKTPLIRPNISKSNTQNQRGRAHHLVHPRRYHGAEDESSWHRISQELIWESLKKNRPKSKPSPSPPCPLDEGAPEIRNGCAVNPPKISHH
jgi:hypothetical protein